MKPLSSSISLLIVSFFLQWLQLWASCSEDLSNVYYIPVYDMGSSAPTMYVNSFGCQCDGWGGDVVSQSWRIDFRHRNCTCSITYDSKSFDLVHIDVLMNTMNHISGNYHDLEVKLYHEDRMANVLEVIVPLVIDVSIYDSEDWLKYVALLGTNNFTNVRTFHPYDDMVPDYTDYATFLVSSPICNTTIRRIVMLDNVLVGLQFYVSIRHIVYNSTLAGSIIPSNSNDIINLNASEVSLYRYISQQDEILKPKPRPNAGPNSVSNDTMILVGGITAALAVLSAAILFVKWKNRQYKTIDTSVNVAYAFPSLDATSHCKINTGIPKEQEDVELVLQDIVSYDINEQNNDMDRFTPFLDKSITASDSCIPPYFTLAAQYCESEDYTYETCEHCEDKLVTDEDSSDEEFNEISFFTPQKHSYDNFL